MCRKMPKVIDSLQLHISHQMRSYSSAKIMRIQLYLLFFGGGTWALRQFEGKRAQITLNQVYKESLEK